ncbi:MAG: 30S ribosomal protein S16 [Chloroflexi bacterium]|nr:30S ribosomal protein S16 [Chloroflexota bacterium]
MPVRIRLRRVGKKKQPNYRLVVADSRAPRDGAFIETLGTYDPLTEPATIVINEERAKAWLAKGAIPSERAERLLASKGIVEAPVTPQRAKKVTEEPKAEAPAAAATAPAAAAAPATEAAAPAEDAPAAE